MRLPSFSTHLTIDSKKCSLLVRQDLNNICKTYIFGIKKKVGNKHTYVKPIFNSVENRQHKLPFFSNVKIETNILKTLVFSEPKNAMFT